MNVSYDYYRVFYYVATFKNFTHAAEKLMNSQPNITRTIKQLENTLGCRLFERSNRGVSLTPEGELLYEHIAVAFRQIEAGEEALIRPKNLKGGHVSIGVSEAALHGLLLPVLSEFHKTYPDIRIQISNHSTPQAISALQNRLVAFAIVTTPTDAPAPLIETPLKTYREILIGGAQFQALAQKKQSLRDLIPYPFVSLGKHAKTYQFYNQFFSIHGLVFNPEIEVATTDQILPLVKNNLGIGFIPEYLAEEALARGEIIQISLEEVIPERQICLVESPDQTLSLAANAFKESLINRHPKS